MYLFIIGRERDLCTAELECKVGIPVKINEEALIVNTTEKPDINSLGGTIKVAQMLDENIKDMKSLQEKIADHIIDLSPVSKFSFGLSYYGQTKLNIMPIGLKVKKMLVSSGIKPRVVLPKSDNKLNAASVIHNKLISNGAEFIIAWDGKKYLLAKTVGVQDIDSYSKRDYEKPCRDRKVGMLPPKLSQIMINLAKPEKQSLIVDPFCGSGGLLMEASLMGYDSSGSDLSEKMIDCSNKNTEWFLKNYPAAKKITITSALDATTRDYPARPYTIVTEGYLGQNFIHNPNSKIINDQIQQLKNLYLEFFENIKKQKIQPNSVVVCMPFWKLPNSTIQLNVVDEIINLGYTIAKFKSVRPDNLKYYREGQFTGRQIIVFKPN